MYLSREILIHDEHFKFLNISKFAPTFRRKHSVKNFGWTHLVCERHQKSSRYFFFVFVIMVMDKFFFCLSCLPYAWPSCCLFFSSKGRRVWLRGLDIMVEQNKASLSLLFSLFPFFLLSKFEMYYGLSRVLLWRLTCLGLWFIDPISARFCVSRSVFIKKGIKTRTNAKGGT